MLKKSWFWVIVLGFVLLLTQIHPFLSLDGMTYFLGLPAWLVYFMFVHLIVIFIIYVMGKKYFNNENSDK